MKQADFFSQDQSETTIVLEESARKSVRIDVRAECQVKCLKTSGTYAVQILNISVGGMCISFRGNALKEGSIFQADFRLLGTKRLSVQGRIISRVQMLNTSQSNSSREQFRCSIQFDRTLSQKELLALLESCDVSSPELEKSYSFR